MQMLNKFGPNPQLIGPFMTQLVYTFGDHLYDSWFDCVEEGTIKQKGVENSSPDSTASAFC